MACDMHLRVETMSDGGEWVNLPHPPGLVDWGDHDSLSGTLHGFDGSTRTVSALHVSVWNRMPTARVYAVYERLSGVRGDGEALFGRGLPGDADLSDIGPNARHYTNPNDIDSHTPDHALLSEVLEAEWGELESTAFVKWARKMGQHFEPTRTRVIWWFDN